MIAGRAPFAGVTHAVGKSVAAPSRNWPLLTIAALGPLVAGLLAWGLSLSAIDVDSLGEYGLLPEFPPEWYAGLAALVLGAVAVIWGPRPNGWVIAAYVGGVTLVLYATVPAVTDAPQYAWTYKHIGVTRLIEMHGQADPSVDIYNRWPGFFALTAVFSQLSGLGNPVSYAAWSEPLFALVDTLLVGAVARAVVSDVRVAGYAALVFVLGNWVGGQYFSPQALAFTLALAVLLLVVRCLANTGGAAPRVMNLVERVTRRAQRPLRMADPLPWRRRTSVAVVIFLDAVLVATHQLTPYILLLQVGALVLLGVVRPRWLLLAMAALAVLYLLPNLDFVQRKYGVFSSANPLQNVSSPTEVFDLDPVAGKRLNGHASAALTLALWTLSLMSALYLARRGYARRALPLLATAFAPLGVLLLQSYGGEAALRVMLFSSPWCGVLMAWAIGAVRRPDLRLFGALLASVGLASLFVPAYYGAQQLFVIPGGEVRAAEHFFAKARAGSVLVTTAVGFPGNVGPRYPLMRDVQLMEQDRFRHRPLGARDVPAVIALMDASPRKGYVVFSTSQRRYVSTFRLTPPGALRDLERAIAASQRFRLWYATDDARIYQLIESTGA